MPHTMQLGRTLKNPYMLAIAPNAFYKLLHTIIVPAKSKPYSFKNSVWSPRVVIDNQNISREGSTLYLHIFLTKQTRYVLTYLV